MEILNIMNRYRLTKYLLIAVMAVWFFSSCDREDDLNTDASVKLDFSANKVLFDTVFSTVGSTTYWLKVYNNDNKRVKISTIRLAGGSNSPFRINIDGNPAIEKHDIEIAAKDSMFVFVEVTVDPHDNSPILIEDSIIFITNGNFQVVDLVALGQDAHYHLPTDTLNFSDGSSLLFSYAGCISNWTKDKPHLIYGYTVVDTDSILRIEKGTQIHLHNNAVLWVYEGGSLIVEGEKEEEVVFQGDRLEDWYDEQPGQWGKIWLSAGSKNNQINYAIIKNGFVGLHIDTLGHPSDPTLVINNSIIKNMSYAGIYAQGTKIRATNCIIANCAEHLIALKIGGNYDFRHCTFGNYWSYYTRHTPSVWLNNWYEDVYGNIHIRPIENAYFGNCIIYGNIEDELVIDDKYSGILNYTFDHCLIKTELNFSSSYINCLKNQDPQFENSYENDYTLRNNSPAIDAGSGLIGVSHDINGKNRDGNPDLGAYEKVD